MSRCSSRKSSRCSDGSDMSEMAGPWLNLPLMLVSGTGDMKDIKVENNNSTDLSLPEARSSGRRRSFYNLFLGRQDAVDDSLVSPSANRKGNRRRLSLNYSSFTLRICTEIKINLLFSFVRGLLISILLSSATPTTSTTLLVASRYTQRKRLVLPQCQAGRGPQQNNSGC